MKKHRIFNPRLYFYGLKSTSIIGVCCMALICLIYAQNDRPNILESFVTAEMYYDEPDRLILSVILAFVPVFIFTAFSFLRSRAATDFMHSMPETRLSTLTSYFSAAMTWPVLICFLYYLFIFLLLICCGKTPSFAYFFPPILSFFSTLTLLSGLSLFAVSITGTLFTGISVFLGSVLVPVSSAIYLLVALSYSPVYNFINIDTEALSDMAEFVQTSLFSFLAGLVLLIISAFLYTRRRSELSGRTSVSKRSHVILSLFVTYPVMCAVSLVLLLYLFISPSERSWRQLTLFLMILLVTAFVVWFILNLILKKSLSRAFISMRWSALMLAVPVALVSVFLISSASVISFAPDSNEVESISVAVNYSHKLGSRNTYEVFYQRLDGMTFTDEESKKILCDTLKYKIASTVDNSLFSIKTEDYESDAFSRPDTEKTYIQAFVTVTYKLKNGRNVTRINCFTDRTFAALCEIEQHTERLLYIDPHDVISHSYRLPYGSDPIYDDGCSFIEEYNNAPVEERVKAIFGSYYSAYLEFYDKSTHIGIPNSFINTRKAMYESGVANGSVSSAEEITPLLSGLVNDFRLDTDPFFFGMLSYNGTDYLLPGNIYYEDLYPFARDSISLILSDPHINEEVDIKGSYVYIFCNNDQVESGIPSILKISDKTALALIEQINLEKEASKSYFYG